MIRQSVRTGRTFSTSSIHREVIQAQGKRIEPELHVFQRLSSHVFCQQLPTFGYSPREEAHGPGQLLRPISA